MPSTDAVPSRDPEPRPSTDPLQPGAGGDAAGNGSATPYWWEDPDLAAAVAEVEQLISGGQVQVVVHNPQTESPVTARVRDRAAAAGIPVVEMTETLPEGKDYLSWMTEQVNALATALGRS